MAFIPVPHTIQARLIWQEDNGVTAQNVFYHGATAPVTLEQMETIGGIWGEMMTEAGFVTVMTDNWALSSVAMRDMTEQEGIALNFTDGMPISGMGTGGASPDQVAYTVTWYTGLVGRSARGRTYGVGLPLSFIVNRNQLTSAGRTALQNGWNVVREGFEEAGHAIQVVSFEEAGIFRTEGRALPALSHQVRFPLATRRSRLT